MGAHRGELGGASLVRFLAESIVGYLGGTGGEIVLFPPPNSVDSLREVVSSRQDASNGMGVAMGKVGRK